MLSKTQFFSSFRHPRFRLYWLSGVIASLAGGQMVLTSWLVLETTESALLLGLTMALRFGPQILGAVTGLAADRINRRRLLIIIRGTRIVFSLTYGILILGGQIQYWHITILSLLQSIINTFWMPTSSAFSVDLVGEKDVANATALQRLTMTLTGIVGPSIVGVLVNQVGIGPFYFFNAAIHALSTIPLLMIRGAERTHTPLKKSLKKDFVDGFKYSWNNKGVLGGQMIVLITNLFMWPCSWTLLPLFAKDVLNVGAAGLAWLSTANRLGGLVANSVVAHFGDFKGKGRIALIASLGWGSAWILLATTNWFPLSIIYLLVSGLSSTFTMGLAQIILLMNASPEMRGRVMGIRSLMVFPQSPMSIVAGVAVEMFGVPITAALEGSVFIISMLITAKWLPSLRTKE